MNTSASIRPARSAALMLAGAALAMAAHADPILPDWTLDTFGPNSSVSTHKYYPLEPGLLSVYQGAVENGAVERIQTLVTSETKTILGVQTRVIRDRTFMDGILVEVADDWYAQSDEGTVWYFGEYVKNFHYDQNGDLIGIDNAGSWIADGVANLPGAIMLADPKIGDEYFQEYAPDVALDFAVVNSLTDTVDIPFGVFHDVLNTAEGNFIDGPALADNKLYAPGVGLVLIEPLDDAGDPEFNIPLISRRMVPAPGAPVVAIAGAALGATRRRTTTSRPS